MVNVILILLFFIILKHNLEFVTVTSSQFSIILYDLQDLGSGSWIRTYESGRPSKLCDEGEVL